MKFKWIPITNWHISFLYATCHNTLCLYKEVDKKCFGCNLMTTELLDCGLTGVCVVIRSITVRWNFTVLYKIRTCFSPLRGLGTVGSFSAILYKGDNFCYFLYGFPYSKPFLKSSLLCKEELALVSTHNIQSNLNGADILGTLTHCRLIRLSNTIYWKSPISKPFRSLTQ